MKMETELPEIPLVSKFESDEMASRLENKDRTQRIRDLAQGIQSQQHLPVPPEDLDLDVLGFLLGGIPKYDASFDAAALDKMGYIGIVNLLLGAPDFNPVQFYPILEVPLRTQYGKQISRIRKARMVDFLVTLAEETGRRYPIEARKFLHLYDADIQESGNFTIVTLPYVPKTGTFFESAVRERYGLITKQSESDRKVFLIFGSLNNDIIQELVWWYLPEPRILQVTPFRHVGGN